MDFALTASGEYEGKPLLQLSPVPDQDHPDTMNQVIWSLMDLLAARGIEGVPFDKENPASYNRVRLAILDMILASASVKATLAEVRQGVDDEKFVTSLGAAAAAGNYSKYISVTTTPYAMNGNDVGGFFIATGSAASFTLPLLTSVGRVGLAYTVQNFKTTGNITILRNGANTLSGVAGSTTAVVLAPGQSVTLVAISATVWAVINSATNQHINDNTIGAGCAVWFPSRGAIDTGYIPADGQILSRSNAPRVVAKLGVLPVVTDANWIATSANRGSYSSGDLATTIRVPDYNGKYSTDVALFLRGDGGNALAVGQISPSAIQAHTHDYNGIVGLGVVGPGAGSGLGNKTTTSTGGTETIPWNVAGVWCIKL